MSRFDWFDGYRILYHAWKYVYARYEKTSLSSSEMPHIQDALDIIWQANNEVWQRIRS